MKNIFKIASLALVLFSAFSCENDDQMIVSATGGPELLTPTSGASYVLLPENAAAEATTLVWNHASYDLQTAANYDVEVAIAGTNFETIVSTQRTPNSARFLVWTVEGLNTIALAAGIEPYTEGELDVRVKSSLGDTAAEVAYSNSITIKITPYTTETPKIYVVGSFLNASGYGDDWTPASAVPLASTGFGETDFEGYVYMNVAAPEFKFLPTNSSFDGDYGDDGSFSGVLVQEGESNCQTTGPAYYRIQADTDLLTYNLTPTTWGIIGAATPGGWDNSTPLTYNATTKKWEAIVVMTAAAYKFRANNAWDINLGGDNDDDTFMNYGGPDLILDAAGTYKVELDLSNPREYTYALTAQ